MKAGMQWRAYECDSAVVCLCPGVDPAALQEHLWGLWNRKEQEEVRHRCNYTRGEMLPIRALEVHVHEGPREPLAKFLHFSPLYLGDTPLLFKITIVCDTDIAL